MRTDQDLYEDNSLFNEEEKQRKLQQEEAIKLAIEQRDVPLHLKAVMETESGKKFLKFLFKSFQVGELPAEGIEDRSLYETIGYLRAGHSVFQLAAQANKKIAAELLAQIQGEKYAKIPEIHDEDGE